MAILKAPVVTCMGLEHHLTATQTVSRILWKMEFHPKQTEATLHCNPIISFFFYCLLTVPDLCATDREY